MSRELQSNTRIILGGREYTIQKTIGHGASCFVYHAICKDLTEHIIKEFNPRNIAMYRESDGELCLESEDDRDEFEAGLVRFREGHTKQRELRLDSDLKNSTSNVQGIYEANGTEYIDMTCFAGDSYEKVNEKSVYDLLRRMKALAQVIGNYHKAGLLHLDIKPENIFTLPETCEMVMLFDFDSVVSKENVAVGGARSYTLSWAAPEQTNPLKRKNICEATDVFAVGEMIFYQLMDKKCHSTTEERLSFAEYNFDHKLPIFENLNPKVFPMLEELLHRTICVSIKERYQSTDDLIAKLDEIIAIADPKAPYLKSSLPAVQDFFVGRENEIEEIHRKLSENRILFLNGIGGIGKSELAKHYADTYRAKYDTIIFAPYFSDVNMLLQDDMALPLHNFSRYPEEKPEEYCARKLRKLQELCGERTLFIVDNLDREDDPDLSKLLDLECQLLITTRMDFSDYGYGQQLYLDALYNRNSILEIFHKYYTKPLTEEETACVEQIIDLVAGHTMTVELLAKQMMAGRVKPDQMLAKLQDGGISESGKEKVRSSKDGVLSTRSAYNHIQTLFDLSELDKDEQYVLANLALIPHTGISIELFHNWCGLKDYDSVNRLVVEGWVRLDKEKDFVSLHPLVLDIWHDIVHIEDITIFLSRFTENLTDDDTGEVILQVCTFSFANTIASILLVLFQKKQLIPTEEAIHCLGRIGDFFFEQGLYDFAEQSYCAQQEFYKTLNLTDAYLALVIYNSLALLYDKQGELFGKRELSEKALCYHKECLLIAEDPQNNMTEYISRVYGNIGSVYHTLKDYVNAENYYKKALEHSNRYSFCNNLGVLYDNQGHYIKALEMHQEAMKRAVEHNEPELVIALIEHNMAVSYKKLGEFTEAAAHCEKALHIREKNLASGVSYDLAISKSVLGQIYVELGDPDLIQEAERLLCEAVLSLEKIVGVEHIEYEKALAMLKSFFKKDFTNNTI